MVKEETGEDTLKPWNGESGLRPLQTLAKILERLQWEDERETERERERERKSLLEKRTIKGKLSLTVLIMRRGGKNLPGEFTSTNLPVLGLVCTLICVV